MLNQLMQQNSMHRLYHTNHPDNTAHAGAAILIKDSVAHCLLRNYSKDCMQATSIMVVTQLPLASKFILGGDFNSKNTLCGSRLSTAKGEELAKLLHEKKYAFLSSGILTYWPTDCTKTPDHLDFFISSFIAQCYMDIESSHDLSSDHSPIVSTAVIKKKTAPKLHNSKTDWDTFRDSITENVNLNIRLKNPEELEVATINFISLIQHAAKIVTPQPKLQNSTQFTPIEIKKLIIDKRGARAKWQRYRSPTDKTIYNRISNTLKGKLKELRDNSFQNYIVNLSRYDNSIWRVAISALKPIESNHPIRIQSTPPGPWAKRSKEKANLFAKHLEDVFSPNSIHPDQDIVDCLNAGLTNSANSSSIRLVSTNEVKKEISKLNNKKKSLGSDLITATIFKELPKKGIVVLTYIFNAVFRLNYWPKSLKATEIMLFSKPGKDPSDVSSYRPISLLPVISKVLERLLFQRITPYLNFIPNHQFGFRRQHSTIQQCHRVVRVRGNVEVCTNNYPLKPPLCIVPE
ncbi:PREDICTED: RNA-directed DNA polymerase from mobile element jockey-like [Eufriesea mexicana]|uniref:RNA-directed DNA polymerase from mobile element jockey-like n=1 Tax=Eufriesea mexicana TaxID=516756 RepID=UPI00083C4A6A|nr:PREDICTED: RNA-directed DNA polymerase from mobile element jockey-like [Eufriesea mexicana]